MSTFFTSRSYWGNGTLYIYICIWYIDIFIYLYIYIFIYLYTYIFIYLYIYILIYLYIYIFIYLYIYIFIYSYIYIFILYLYIHIFIYLYIYIFIYLYLYIYLYICIFTYLFIYLKFHIVIYEYIYIFIYLYIHIFIYSFLYIHVFLYNYIYTFCTLKFTYIEHIWYIFAYRCICIYIYVYTYIYIYIHMYIYIHGYVYIYIYMIYVGLLKLRLDPGRQHGLRSCRQQGGKTLTYSYILVSISSEYGNNKVPQPGSLGARLMSGGCLCHLFHLEIFCSVEPRTKNRAPGSGGLNQPKKEKKKHTWGYHWDTVCNGISLFINIGNMYIPTEKKTSSWHLSTFKDVLTKHRTLQQCSTPLLMDDFVIILNMYEVILYYHTLLVGGLEHFLFSHILGIIIPIDFHVFQRGGPTTNQIILRIN